jgi:hypothetical protein
MNPTNELFINIFGTANSTALYLNIIGTASIQGRVRRTKLKIFSASLPSAVTEYCVVLLTQMMYKR